MLLQERGGTFSSRDILPHRQMTIDGISTTRRRLGRRVWTSPQPERWVKGHPKEKTAWAQGGADPQTAV